MGRSADRERAPGHGPARAAAAEPLRALALLAALALAACAGDGAEGPSATRAADGPEALAARLPEDLAGLRRGSDAPFPGPPAGREVAYATANRQAAGFVQVLRADAALPDGASSPAVQAEFTRWRDASSTEAGRNRRLRVVGERDEAGLFRCAELEGNYGRQPMRSTVCVGAAGGQLVRLRLTQPRREPPAADAAAFVRELAAALRR